MPTLIVENVPPVIYERLRRRAAERHRSLPEETLHLLEQVLREDRAPSPRLPDLIVSEEAPAPYDLPRSSRPAPVPAQPGRPRLPDPPTGDAPQ
jgi:plasmid stability protein